MKCPSDYRVWLQTMYILFGTKFFHIFGGPLWSGAPIMQANDEDETSKSTLCPLNVSSYCVHIILRWI